MLEQVTSLAPLLGPVFAAIVVIVGWPAVHYLNQRRDRANKRHDLISKYLLEAYRRLETAAHRPDRTDEHLTAFESAIADIQLLGSKSQVDKVNEYIKAQTSLGSATITGVLCELRNDLRKELRLSPIAEPPAIFRFTREPKGTRANKPQ